MFLWMWSQIVGQPCFAFGICLRAFSMAICTFVVSQYSNQWSDDYWIEKYFQIWKSIKILNNKFSWILKKKTLLNLNPIFNAKVYTTSCGNDQIALKVL